MLRYLPIIAVVGVLFAVAFAVVDKLTAKIENKRKRKYVKIASYLVL